MACPPPPSVTPKKTTSPLSSAAAAINYNNPPPPPSRTNLRKEASARSGLRREEGPEVLGSAAATKGSHKAVAQMVCANGDDWRIDKWKVKDQVAIDALRDASRCFWHSKEQCGDSMEIFIEAGNRYRSRLGSLATMLGMSKQLWDVFQISNGSTGTSPTTAQDVFADFKKCGVPALPRPQEIDRALRIKGNDMALQVMHIFLSRIVGIANQRFIEDENGYFFKVAFLLREWAFNYFYQYISDFYSAIPVTVNWQAGLAEAVTQLEQLLQKYNCDEQCPNDFALIELKHSMEIYRVLHKNSRLQLYADLLQMPCLFIALETVVLAMNSYPKSFGVPLDQCSGADIASVAVMSKFLEGLSVAVRVGVTQDTSVNIRSVVEKQLQYHPETNFVHDTAFLKCVNFCLLVLEKMCALHNKITENAERLITTTRGASLSMPLSFSYYVAWRVKAMLLCVHVPGFADKVYIQDFGKILEHINDYLLLPAECEPSSYIKHFDAQLKQAFEQCCKERKSVAWLEIFVPPPADQDENIAAILRRFWVRARSLGVITAIDVTPLAVATAKTPDGLNAAADPVDGMTAAAAPAPVSPLRKKVVDGSGSPSRTSSPAVMVPGGGLIGMQERSRLDREAVNALRTKTTIAGQLSTYVAQEEAARQQKESTMDPAMLAKQRAERRAQRVKKREESQRILAAFQKEEAERLRKEEEAKEAAELAKKGDGQNGDAPKPKV